MHESRRSAGVVERGGLENRCARERTVGSNPTSSAINSLCQEILEISTLIL